MLENREIPPEERGDAERKKAGAGTSEGVRSINRANELRGYDDYDLKKLNEYLGEKINPKREREDAQSEEAGAETSEGVRPINRTNEPDGWDKYDVEKLNGYIEGKVKTIEAKPKGEGKAGGEEGSVATAGKKWGFGKRGR